MCSTCVPKKKKKSGTFLVAASILASTSATVQYGRRHACIQITTILTRKTANISLTPGFFKLSNYRQLQLLSDIGNARQCTFICIKNVSGFTPTIHSWEGLVNPVIYISFNTITFIIHFFCNLCLFFLNDTASHLIL